MPLSFRDVTLYGAVHHDLDVLVEIESEFTDIYYKWMRSKGLLDFVDQFVKPNEESGIFIDRKRTRPSTIFIERIVPENLRSIRMELDGFLKTKRRAR